MNRLLARVLLGIGLVSCAGASAKNPEAERAADAAARQWLTLVDEAKYSESWDASAAYFRGAVTRDAWVTAVKGVREPLGAVESRELKRATYATTLPGAPDGQYVVIQYTTSFAGKASSIETVTPMREADGSWKVSGYFVK
jgi:hypothetical protein